MKDKNKKEHVVFDIDICNASSAHDCTGLIPSAIQDEDELHEYSKIANYSPVSAVIKNKKTNDES